MEKLLSTIKKIKDLDYNQKFEIKKLFANPDTLEAQRNQMKSINPKATPDEVEKRVFNLVVRDNVFNAIMNYIVTYYEFSIDKSEIEKYSERVKTIYKNAPAEKINEITEITLKKTLVFSELAKLWDIRTTDEETKNSLQNYYKMTNNPIRDILENKNQFEGYRQMIQDQKITAEIIMRFRNVKIDLPKPDTNKPQEQTGK
mgnify:CR=1 FL=1